MNATADVTRVSIYHSILWSKYKGGVFSQVHAQAQNRGIDVQVTQIAETEGQRVFLNGIDLSYHNYPYRLLFHGSHEHVAWYKRMYAAGRDVLKHPSDLVILPGYHYAEYWSMLFMCMLLRRKRATFSDSTMLDKPEIGWREVAKRFFFSRCDGCFTYGERSREYLLSYGVDPSKIFIRRQAAALPHDYDPKRVMQQYEAQAPLDPAMPVYLYIGRLSEEKGLVDLLQAFKKVLESSPKARLMLVGGGPQRDELLALYKQMGLEDSVEFTGSKSLEELVNYFYSSTAMVLPSHSEPWGLVVNESLSYGCPVVVSDACGCVPELALDDVTGYRHVTGDVASLTDAMLKVREMSRDRIATARRCLDVIAEFSPERTAEQLLDGCERIIHGDAPAATAPV